MTWANLVARMWDGNHLFSVLLELTYSCDQACHICYNPPHERDGLLTLDHYRRLLHDLAGMGTLNLTLSGGEPLLHPDFLTIGRTAREQGFAVRVKTNGLRLDRALAETIRREIDPFGVDVSLHGARAVTHDLQTRVPGSFDRIVENVRGMRERGLRVRLRLPLTRWNQCELNDALALADTLGVPLDVDPEISPRDDGDAEPLALAASEEGLAALATTLRPRHEAERARAAEARAGSPPSRAPRRHCGAGGSTVAIDPCGEVFPCVQWRRSAGNLHHASIREIWESSPVLAEIRGVLESLTDQVASARRTAPMGYCPGVAETRGDDPGRLPSFPGLRERFLTMLSPTSTSPGIGGP